MRDIAELTVLLHERIALRDHFKLVTEEFREGWDFVQSGDVHWLDEKIRRCGWHFIRIGAAAVHSSTAKGRA